MKCWGKYKNVSGAEKQRISLPLPTILVNCTMVQITDTINIGRDYYKELDYYTD